MKRFWSDVTVERVEGGWQVTLDARRVKTAQGRPQIVPTAALAEALAAEWRAQGDEIDPASLPLRDLADFAIDVVAPARAETVARILAFAQGDTLCYRAEPDEPLAIRQRELWEPLLKACEVRHDVRFERTAGIVPRPQPEATLAVLRAHLETLDDFALAALHTLASLAASATVGLAALEPDADATTLYAAANLEEDWQAEQWGWDAEAEQHRAKKLAAFALAARLAMLARS